MGFDLQHFVADFAIIFAVHLFVLFAAIDESLANLVYKSSLLFIFFFCSSRQAGEQQNVYHSQVLSPMDWS